MTNNTLRQRLEQPHTYTPSYLIDTNVLIRLSALAHAFYGATRNSRTYLADYKERLDRELSPNPEGLNPAELILLPRFQEILSTTDPGTIESKLTLPWAYGVTVTMGGALCALCSFADAHKGTIPAEYFPVELSFKFIDLVQRASKDRGKPLDLADQYILALEQVDYNPLAAAILAHSAFRLAGRNRDTRVHPDFNLDLDRRVSIANSVAHFYMDPLSRKDPLGDTYHYWAQYSAGMIAHFKRKDTPVKSKFFYLFFYNGANIIHLVHEKMLGNAILFGLHKKVDRLGLRMGVKIAEWIESRSAI